MASAVTTCPGCGLQSREAGVEPDPRSNASSACWGAHAELVGFEYSNLAALGR